MVKIRAENNEIGYRKIEKVKKSKAGSLKDQQN